MSKKVKAILVAALLLSLVSCGSGSEQKQAFSDKEEIPLYVNVANEYIGLQLYDKAKNEIEKILKIDPKNAQAYHLLGYIATLQGKSADAIANYDKAIEFDPQYSSPYFLVSLEYIRQGNNEKAKEYLLKLEKIKPDKYTLGNLGNIFYGEKNIPKAEEYLKRAIDLSNNDFHTPYVTLARIENDRGNVDKAIELLEKAISIKNESVDAHEFLGNLYLGKFDLDKAQLHFEAVLKIRSEHLPAINPLAFIYAEKKIHLDESEALLKKEGEINPANKMYFADNLAWVLYMKEDYKQAKETIDPLIASIEKDDSYPKSNKAIAFFHKGMIEQKLGNKDEAKKYLTTASSIGIIAKYNDQINEVLKK